MNRVSLDPGLRDFVVGPEFCEDLVRIRLRLVALVSIKR